MARLDSPARLRALVQLANDLTADGSPHTLTKPQLLAAVDGIDQWIEDNAAAINAAIPQPARGVLTMPQKAAVVAYVAMTRYGK